MQSGRQAKPRLEASQEVHAFMALYKAHSAAIYGIDAHLIDVEVDLYPSGTASYFFMVGMPDTAVRESREMGQVRSHQLRFQLSV